MPFTRTGEHVGARSHAFVSKGNSYLLIYYLPSLPCCFVHVVAKSSLWPYTDRLLPETRLIVDKGPIMVERKIELRRRRARGAKLAKYKLKLATAKDGKERDEILKKIHRISPWWKEPAKA